MKQILILSLLWLFPNNKENNEMKILFDFNTNSTIETWRVVNDGVMGGLSKGYFEINPEGQGRFYGDVSLDNNGGFSSVRYIFPKILSESYTHFSIKVKGDGKRYQMRVKSNADDRHSYMYYFTSPDTWQEIDIPFTDMYPSFRGRNLDIPNFNGEEMAEIAFLIANEKNESFELLIDHIKLK